MTRAFGLLLAIVLSLAMALALMGCEGAEGTQESAPTEPSADESVEVGPMTDDDLRAALEAEYGDATWYPSIMWVGTDQVLLADITRVETDLDTEGADYDTAVEISDAMWQIMGDQDVINISIVAGNGMQLSASGTGSPMSEAMELPAAPTSAEELQSWIDSVYGSSGEDWYGHLEGIEISDTIGGWKGTTLIVVQTDLEGREPETIDIVKTMGQAIASSGQTIAENHVVYMGSGEQLMSGNLPPASSYSY